MSRITITSTSMLITTRKLDFLHRVVWLPPASSSVDSTFEEKLGQTFPTDLGDEGPFLGTIRAAELAGTARATKMVPVLASGWP